MAAIGSSDSRPIKQSAEEEIKPAEEALNDQIRRINDAMEKEWELSHEVFSKTLNGPYGKFIKSELLEHKIKAMTFANHAPHWLAGIAVLKSSHAQRLNLAGPVEFALRSTVLNRKWDQCLEILEIPAAYNSLSHEAAWRLLNINFIREKNSRLIELSDLRDYTESYKRCYKLLSHRHFRCVIL